MRTKLSSTRGSIVKLILRCNSTPFPKNIPIYSMIMEAPNAGRKKKREPQVLGAQRGAHGARRKYSCVRAAGRDAWCARRAAWEGSETEEESQKIGSKIKGKNWRRRGKQGGRKGGRGRNKRNHIIVAMVRAKIWNKQWGGKTSEIEWKNAEGRE